MSRYELPDWLRRHSGLVLVAAESLARALADAGERVEMEPLRAAAYLHDIGKSPLLEADPRGHNELSALVLAAEGMPELGELVRRHIVFAILDPELMPRTIEEKIVYYADRRAGLEIVSVDERLREQAGRFPDSADAIMACLEPVLALERELFAKIPFPPERLCGRP